MLLTRITATLGAVALGGVLVASTTTAGASAPVHPPRPAPERTVVHDRFVPPTPHRFRPHSNLRMGLHCDSTDMSI
jgi:hypothetical protein